SPYQSHTAMSRPKSDAYAEALAPYRHVGDAPEREIHRTQPVQHVGHQRSRAGGVEETGKPLQRRFDSVLNCALERAAEPDFFRRRETELVPAPTYFLWQQAGHGAAQYSFRVAAHDLVVVSEGQAEFHQAMVDERHPRLDRMRHRIPVLPMKQHLKVG